MQQHVRELCHAPCWRTLWRAASRVLSSVSCARPLLAPRYELCAAHCTAPARSTPAPGAAHAPPKRPPSARVTVLRGRLALALQACTRVARHSVRVTAHWAVINAIGCSTAPLSAPRRGEGALVGGASRKGGAPQLGAGLQVLHGRSAWRPAVRELAVGRASPAPRLCCLTEPRCVTLSLRGDAAHAGCRCIGHIAAPHPSRSGAPAVLCPWMRQAQLAISAALRTFPETSCNLCMFVVHAHK